MWLADIALEPELPVGWLRCGQADGTAFYWNTVCGATQWEHPHVSFLTGVATRLVRERKAEAAKLIEKAAALRPESART